MTEVGETLSMHSTARWKWGATAALLAGSYVLVYTLSVALDAKWYRSPLTFFFLSLAVSFIAVAQAPVRSAVHGQINRLSAFLARRRAFRSDAILEAPKFALLRILFGAFMVERCIWILLYLQPSDWSQPSIWMLAVFYLIVSLMVTTGVLTQFALAYLILVQWQVGDWVLLTSTLGNDIAAILAVLLIFANAGAHFSIDRWLVGRGGRIGSLVSATYYRNGLPPDAVLQLAKFLTLLAYWLVCLYSLSMHLNEPAWMNGTAGPLLLANNFMSKFPDAFTAFFGLGGWAVMLGRIALWAMLPWYALVLPFVLLGGVLRAYVIVWAILFFLLSLFVLQLGSLAHFEFLLLAGWFWERRFMAGPKTLHVAYDDRCNLCDRTVSFVKFADIFRRVELRPLSVNGDWLKSRGIDPQDALTDLYGVEVEGNGRTAKGYDFYVLLSRHVLLLTPFLPFLLAGRYLGGPQIYRFIAERRTRLFGVCEIPTPKAEYDPLPVGTGYVRAVAGSDPAGPIGVHFVFLALAYLVAIPAPYLGWQGIAMPYAVRAAHIYGIAPINVFNERDLRLAEKWFTVVGVDGEGSEEMLPILGENGIRLAMHVSDRVYFGHTLRYRRRAIDKDGCLFEEHQGIFVYLTESHRRYGLFDRFLYRQYFQPLPPVDFLLKGVFRRAEIVKVCEIEF